MTPAQGAVRPVEEVLLGFARALRAAGVLVTPDRERSYLEAVAAVGLADRRAVYHAGRATLCSSPADLERHDDVYAAWFGAVRPGRPRRAAQQVVARAGAHRRRRERAGLRRAGGGGGPGERDGGAAPPRCRDPRPP